MFIEDILFVPSKSLMLRRATAVGPCLAFLPPDFTTQITSRSEEIYLPHPRGYYGSKKAIKMRWSGRQLHKKPLTHNSGTAEPTVLIIAAPG